MPWPLTRRGRRPALALVTGSALASLGGRLAARAAVPLGALSATLTALAPGPAWAAAGLSPGPVGSPRWLAAAAGLALGAYLAARQIRRRLR